VSGSSRRLWQHCCWVFMQGWNGCCWVLMQGGMGCVSYEFQPTSSVQKYPACCWLPDWPHAHADEQSALQLQWIVRRLAVETEITPLQATSVLCCMCCRTAHQNVGQLQDLYLPTNTLAALANLAPQVQEATRLARSATLVPLGRILCSA
jgi:hypothetical protein